MQLYHTNGPIGGITAGFVAAALAFVMWTGVFVFFFFFYKRKERAANKLRQQMRLAPPAPRKPPVKKATQTKA